MSCSLQLQVSVWVGEWAPDAMLAVDEFGTDPDGSGVAAAGCEYDEATVLVIRQARR